MVINSHLVKNLASTLAIAALSACQIAPYTQNKTPEIINIKMLDMSYAPAKIDVAHTGRYRVNVSNTSAIPHDIVFSNGARVTVAPGKNESVMLDIPEGGLTYACSMPGHSDAGMKGIVVVNNEDPPSAKPVGSAKQNQAKPAANYTVSDPKAHPITHKSSRCRRPHEPFATPRHKP